VTKKEEDKYFFRVYSLLNVAETPPYFHNGSVDDLSTVIRIMGKDMLKIELTDQEVEDIVAFEHALTGTIPEDFLTIPVLPIGGGKGDFGPGLLPSGKN
jgi:cytochrome c peroxidase